MPLLDDPQLRPAQLGAVELPLGPVLRIRPIAVRSGLEFAASFRAALFDLDGVIVDTARHHFLAWRRLAAELGFTLTPDAAEGIKGVRRDQALEVVLVAGGVSVDPGEKLRLTELKNGWYVESIKDVGESDLLPGARSLLEGLRRHGVSVALVSASKNAPFLLDRLGIRALFDAVVDGNAGMQPKPDPQLVRKAAELLDADPAACFVVEDAEAGLAGARVAGMTAIGVGDPSVLPSADLVVGSLLDIDLVH
jgi:beta-phosphoglucomutase